METLNTFSFFPQKVFAIELEDNAGHAEYFHNYVINNTSDKYAGYETDFRELKMWDLENSVTNEHMEWLKEKIKFYAKEYATVEVKSLTMRSVLMKFGQIISTHTESQESDLGIAYWPCPDFTGTEINSNGDGVNVPTFHFEDPSRYRNELRLPFESIHSISIRPKKNLLVIFPAHLPHSFHPFLGENFVHIVAQVRLDLDKNYLRGIKND